MMMNLPCLKGSCPNFLRPIYHTLSASQAPKQGPCPMVNTDADYSSCFFCSIVTDLHSSVMVLIYSVDAIPLQIPVSLLADVVRFKPHCSFVAIWYHRHLRLKQSKKVKWPVKKRKLYYKFSFFTPFFMISMQFYLYRIKEFSLSWYIPLFPNPVYFHKIDHIPHYNKVSAFH